MSTEYSICSMIGVPLPELVSSKKEETIQVPRYCERTGKLIKNVDVKRKAITLSNGREVVYGVFDSIEMYPELGETGLEAIGYGMDQFIGLPFYADEASGVKIEHKNPSNEAWSSARDAFRALGFNPDTLNIRLAYLLKVS